MHAAAHLDGEQHHAGHEQRHDQRQPNIDEAEHDHRPRDADQRHEGIFRAVVGKFAGLEQVVDDAGHDGARLGGIEVREGQPLYMRKELRPHIRLDAHAQHMPPVPHHIGEHRLEDIDAQERRRPGGDERIGAVRHEVVHDQAGNGGIEEVAHGDDERTAKIQREQLFVRLIIGEKGAHRALLLLRGRLRLGALQGRALAALRGVLRLRDCGFFILRRGCCFFILRGGCARPFVRHTIPLPPAGRPRIAVRAAIFSL